MRKILQPQYVSSFNCIGTDCEVNCCFGWIIAIDKKTYQKYRTLKDEELIGNIKRFVTRNRRNPTDNHYATIHLGNNGECGFLDEKRLCLFHKKHGEDALSIVCSQYPRYYNFVNGVYEKSLTISCIEATRIILLNPQPMEFIETEEDQSVRYMLTASIDTRNSEKVDQYFWDLRIFTITVLQNRDYSLWQRLIVLGLFYEQISKLIDEGKAKNIPEHINVFTRRIQRGDYKEVLSALPNQITVQMELMKELIECRFKEGSNEQRFIRCFAEFLHGIQYTADSSKEAISERYATVCEQYYKPFMDQHEYILENYVVNYVFKNLFPFNGEMHIFDNYVMLVVHYSLVKMLLIGMAGFHQENFDIEHVVKLIQSFSKVIEHNNVYLKNVFELLKSNEFNTMPYMAILIKN